MTDTAAGRPRESSARSARSAGSPRRWRLVVGAVITPLCWFAAFIAARIGNDDWTNCWEDCSRPNHGSAVAPGFCAIGLALLPIVVAAPWRVSRRWRFFSALLALAIVALAVLIVTARPSLFQPDGAVTPPGALPTAPSAGRVAGVAVWGAADAPGVTRLLEPVGSDTNGRQ